MTSHSREEDKKTLTHDMKKKLAVASFRAIHELETGEEPTEKEMWFFNCGWEGGYKSAEFNK